MGPKPKICRQRVREAPGFEFIQRTDCTLQGAKFSPSIGLESKTTEFEDGVDLIVVQSFGAEKRLQQRC